MDICIYIIQLKHMMYTFIFLYTFTNVYIYIIQRITMCPHGYHHNGFMATPALGTYIIYIYLCIHLYYILKHLKYNDHCV